MNESKVSGRCLRRLSSAFTGLSFARVVRFADVISGPVLRPAACHRYSQSTRLNHQNSSPQIPPIPLMTSA
jgi:hypothetical protein